MRIHNRRAEDRGQDNRFAAEDEAKKDIEAFEKEEVRVQRIETLAWRAKAGVCSTEGCCEPVTQRDHHKCNKHTYHFYFPYFVLGQRDYGKVLLAA